MSDQSLLYQQTILDHNRNPKNFCKPAEYTHSAEGLNPLCGDHFEVFITISSEEKIEEISFQGHGCAISKASASIMTETLKGKHIEEAKKIFAEFKILLSDEQKNSDETKLGKLRIFSGVRKFPARVKCANLAWYAMSAALQDEKSASTE